MSDKYPSRAFGFEEIARDAAEMLYAESVTDSVSGERTIDCEAIQRILSTVDDGAHFTEPLAQAAFRLSVDKKARIVWTDSA